MYGDTPLIDAAGKEMVELLIQNGADVNAENVYSETPLVYAVWGNQRDKAEVLLNNGANPNVRDIWAFAPVHYVAKRGVSRADIGELLIAKGADVNLKLGDGKTTALDIAKDNGHTEIVELLKKHGAKE
jgi:ankyrin repeat protein